MASEEHVGKKRIFIVSSYDRNYLWSQSTNRGVTMAIIKKSWMDTKRRNSSKEIAEATHDS